MRQKAATGAVNPMTVKMDLAKRIIADCHSEAEAREAEEDFRRVFQKRELPLHSDVITTLNVSSSDRSWVRDGKLRLNRLLHEESLASSVSEADRKLKEGAVFVNGDRFREPLIQLDHGQPTKLLLKLGRHHREVLVSIM